MPRLDGYSATRQIRGGGFKKPILALTAHASDQDLERVLEAGCNDRLVKPIEFDQSSFAKCSCRKIAMKLALSYVFDNTLKH